MRADTRGRVPFALLGVLLLVSSLTLTPTLVDVPAPTDTAAERALDRATAETQTAVRDGVATAGQRAAVAPVVTPANTTAGRVLNASTPFRDALRVRIYLQVQQRLERVTYRSDGVTVAASLPPVGNATSLRRAKRRVSVAPAGPNRTAMRATVENVTLTVRRGGRVVETRRLSPTVVVATPALMLHDQVSTYERRLNNGLTEPGLSRRLTARLYPIVWARGYAQYGGVPIENVLANRHVSLATNGAALGVQRATFGRSDPDGRRALTEATAVTGIEDLIRGSNDTQYASRVLDEAEYRPVGEEIGRHGSAYPGPGPNDTMRVGVNGTADAAFRAVAGPDALNRTLAEIYSAEVTLVTEDEQLGGRRPPRPPSPGRNWTLVSDRTTHDTDTVASAGGSAAVPDGWHTLTEFGRVVERRYTRTAVWRRGVERSRTTSSSTERWRVSVAVVGRHRLDSLAPDRPISTAHVEGAGPLNGPNLADVEVKAERKLVARAGGRDGVAERVVDGRLDREPTTVRADRPPELRSWVYRDLMALRSSVRNTSITAERGDIGTFRTNPPRELRQRLGDRRETLVDVPSTYNSTAQKARVVARLAYLDEVDRRLGEQASSRDGRRDSVATELADHTDGSLRELRRGLTARETRVPRARPTPTGPAGPVRTRVDARASYLTLAELDERRYPALDGREHPLVARNVNVFTVPYGDAADTVVDALPSADRTRLPTAAATLDATNAATRNGSNATLTAKRDQLRSEVAAANSPLTTGLRRTVRAETPAGHRASATVVADAMATWDGPAARGRALTNGSAPARVARAAGDRYDLSRVERDWLRLRLAEAVAEPTVRPRRRTVDAAASATRSATRDQLKRALADAGRSEAKRLAKKRLDTDKLPAGLPLAPPITPWHATTNVWWVSVQGEYARFAVTASHGPPTSPGAETTYVRDGEPVQLDVDDDGRRERLGTASRVSFSAETGVVIVVPPKPRGVGDKDGNAHEVSGGWPEPGP